MEAHEQPIGGQELPPEAAPAPEERAGLLSRFSGLRTKLFTTILATGMVAGEAGNAAESVTPKQDAPVARRILTVDDVRAIKAKNPDSMFHSRFNKELQRMEYVEMTPEEAAQAREKNRLQEEAREEADRARHRARVVHGDKRRTSSTRTTLPPPVPQEEIIIIDKPPRADGREMEYPPVPGQPPKPIDILLNGDQQLPAEGQPVPEAAPVRQPAAPEAAPDRIDVPDSVKEAQKAMADAGYLVIDHGYEKNNGHEVILHGKSIVAPTGYKTVLVTIGVTVGATGHTKVVVPCPRDIIDQLHVGCIVKVLKNGKELDVPSTVLHSRSKNGDGFHNPFVKVDLRGISGDVVIATEHIVLMPVYPQLGDRDLLKTVDANAAAIITASAETAASVPPNANVSGIDPDQYRRFGSGDCAVKAAVARENGKGYVEVIEGFSFRKPQDAASGHRHIINFVRTPTGMFTFDARSPQDIYRGPLDRQIVTAAGTGYTIPGFSFKIMDNGTNCGCFLNSAYHGQAAGSMRELADHEIPDVAKSSITELANWRMQTYVAPANQQAKAE